SGSRNMSSDTLEVARDLLRRVRERDPSTQVKERAGSFSILGKSSKETAAKIVLYDPGIGKPSTTVPFMRNGVYIWIRANGVTGDAIWGDTLPLEMPWIFRRMQRNQTLEIAPRNGAKFAYFPVMAGDDLEEIAVLLRACAAV
ncbi:MAG TPA: hypothetical protein VI386_18665, partial [Candidatus Sulfotelmatobacter sp.]